MEHTSHGLPRWARSTMRDVAAQSPTLREAALGYARLGIPVFPCRPGDKRPLTPNGFHDATVDVSLVAAWWRRTPDANIGLPTGAVSGVVVVDVDVHPGGSGFAAFERARAEGLARGWGWGVRTPSGGIHAYYPADPGDEQRSWQVPSAHIDFRGEGGYVIVPPSRIEAAGRTQTYRVLTVSGQPARRIDAARLRRFLTPQPPPSRSPGVPRIGAAGCRPEALARAVAQAAEGGRNRTLFWASCRMVESGVSPADALAVLMPAAQQAGLPDREIESTINSAFRTAPRPAATANPPPRLTCMPPSRTVNQKGLQL